MDTAQPLVEQVALVTGAGRGIGAAIARKLSQLGATTVLCGRTKSSLDLTAETITNAGGATEVLDMQLLHAIVTKKLFDTAYDLSISPAVLRTWVPMSASRGHSICECECSPR